MSAPWGPMVAPPLPGGDRLRNICEHGWTYRECPEYNKPAPDAGPSAHMRWAGQAMSLGMLQGVELGGRSVLEHLAGYDGIEPWWADQAHDEPKTEGVAYPMIQSRSWWA